MAQPNDQRFDSVSCSQAESEHFLSAAEAADLLNLKLSTVYALTSERRIPHYKRRGRLHFRRSELVDWLMEGRRPVIDAGAATTHLSKQRGGL